MSSAKSQNIGLQKQDKIKKIGKEISTNKIAATVATLRASVPAILPLTETNLK